MEDLKQVYNAWSAETDAQRRDNVLNRLGLSESQKADLISAFDTMFAYRQGAQYGAQVAGTAAGVRQALSSVGLDAEVRDGENGEVFIRFGEGTGMETELRFVQEVTDPDAAAHAAQGVTPDGVFIRAADGTQVDATQPLRSLIEIQEQSQSGSTFLLGHELAHNLLDVLRRSGQLTAEQDAALAEHFKDENGNFDEEAFADAFAEELRGRFAQQENAKLEEAQGKGGKIRQLLRTLAGTVAAWVYAAKAVVWRRQAQAKQAQPLGGASSVLEAFLQTQSQGEKTFTNEQTAQPNERNTADSFTTEAQNGVRYHLTSAERESITLPDEEMSPDEAKAILLSMQGRKFVNRETKDEALFNKKQIGKLVSMAAARKSEANGFTKSQHNQAVSRVGTLFEFASLVEERSDRDGDVNISRILRFASPTIVDGETCAAYITVKESKKGGERIYSLEMMEIDKLAGNLNARENTQRSAASSEKIIANLREKVKPVDGSQPKFHVPSQADAVYLKAVDAGDMESAQRMVEEEAQKAGYKYEAFHGTNAFGFTVFDPKMSDDGISLFFGGSVPLASTYTSDGAGVREIGDVREIVEPFDFRGYLFGDVLKEAKRLPGAEVRREDFTEEEAEEYQSEGKWVIEKDGNILAEITDGMLYWELSEEEAEGLSKTFNEYLNGTGVYKVALRMDNPLIIEANGARWDRIPGYGTTRNAAEIAKREGYDGVVIENVVDRGGGSPTVSDGFGTVYIAFDGKQVKSLDPVTYDDEGKVVPLSERFDPSKEDIRWHVPSANAPRFSETQEGKVAVAEVFDAMVEGMWDLIADPTTRSQRKGTIKQQDVTTEEGFAKEVNIRIGQFGRAGGKRLQEVKQNLSAEQWLDVLGTVFELGHRFDVWHPEGGLLDVSMRQRVADYLQDIIRNRASALGRRAYLAGRDFAWKQAKAAEAEALAEARAKAQKRVGEVRERKDKEIAEQKEHFKEALAQTRWNLAEERFIADYRVAKARALANQRIERIRAEAAEELKASRQWLARKQAAWREVGITMKQLIPQLGMDVGEELVRIAHSDADIEAETARLIGRIEEAFEAWVMRERPDLVDASYAGRVAKLTEQGERAYAETIGNLLRAMARELEYGRGRESMMTIAEAVRKNGMGHERVTQALEGKVKRTLANLRVAYSKGMVKAFHRRMKKAFAEANKRLEEMPSSAKSRFLTTMKQTLRDLEKAMAISTEARDEGKASPLERRMEELNDILEGAKEGASGEDLTERQHRASVELMFLQRFGGISSIANPMEAYALAVEAEDFVRDALFEHVVAWERTREEARLYTQAIEQAMPAAVGDTKKGLGFVAYAVPSVFDKLKWPLETAEGRAAIDDIERRFSLAAQQEARMNRADHERINLMAAQAYALEGEGRDLVEAGHRKWMELLSERRGRWQTDGRKRPENQGVMGKSQPCHANASKEGPHGRHTTGAIEKSPTQTAAPPSKASRGRANA